MFTQHITKHLVVTLSVATVMAILTPAMAGEFLGSATASLQRDGNVAVTFTEAGVPPSGATYCLGYGRTPPCNVLLSSQQISATITVGCTNNSNICSGGVQTPVKLFDTSASFTPNRSGIVRNAQMLLDISDVFSVVTLTCSSGYHLAILNVSYENINLSEVTGGTVTPATVSPTTISAAINGCKSPRK